MEIKASMADILEKDERLYFGRTRRPHCRTCVCPSNPVKVRSRVTVTSSPPMRRHHHHHHHECAERREPLHCPWDIEHQQQRPHCHHPDRKYDLLKKWFNRFDFDCNGLLDVFELRTLLNCLGVCAGDEYCSRILQGADRDGDGCLTFPEFQILWRQAHNENELLEIVREYDLYPDVVQVETFRRHRPKPQVIETVQRHFGGRQRPCCGCRTSVSKTVRRTPDEDRIEYKARVTRHRSTDQLPVFSCHR
ncbi:hypothetical protein JTE90_007741 [Oedothorax gibbosus]|uniref:EF-hand domain-containing protein n=1 Tax=Oedothorax gibbosus TaxID=931172 RepID=A0AAV6V7Q4_9ARAC|nr:hypothetical protein JTE90_007741 [Oedothorax gibbosus]